MRRVVYGVFTLAAAIVVGGNVFAASLTLPGEPEALLPSEDMCELALPVDEPPARGRIVALDPSGRRVTLEVPPLPPFLPEGGQQVFRVPETVSLGGLAPGDKVRFEYEREGRANIVTRLENSN